MSNNFAQYIFSIGFQMVVYPTIWCPYFFSNFDLSRLHFFEITNNFLISNRLNFYQLNSSSVCLSFLQTLKLSITYESLNRHNLYPDLFKKTAYIGITGILNGIEYDLFEDFTNLNILDLILNNLKEFLLGDTRWMKMLNYKILGGTL